MRHTLFIPTIPFDKYHDRYLHERTDLLGDGKGDIVLFVCVDGSAGDVTR